MFEFLRKNNSNEREQGVSYVANRELEREIKKWLKSVYLDDISFGVVLSKLGFDLDKKLYLKKVSNVDGLSFYYGYESNFNSRDRIDFYITESDKHIQIQNDNRMVLLSGNSYKKYYRFVYDGSNKDGFRFDKQRDLVMENTSNGTYFREMDMYGFSIIVKNKGNSEITLNCSGRFNLEIKNELELEQYLASIITSISVDEVFKKICEISLDDESKFSKVDLTIKKEDEVISSLSYSKEDLFLDFTPKRKFKIKDKNRDVTFYRYLPSRYDDRAIVQIEIISGDYRFVLKVKRSSYNGYAKLDNELELRDYLLNLKFPISIDEVCNEIISKTDIEGRDSIVKMEIYYKNVNTDLLYFEYDYLKQLKITRDGKEIAYDSGVFSYLSNDRDTKVYVDIWRDEVIRCGFETKRGNGLKKIKTDSKLVDDPIEMGIKDANEEIARTRKLTDKIFGRR